MLSRLPLSPLLFSFLAYVASPVAAASLRGAAPKPPQESVQFDDDVELGQVSLVQLEATMHEASRTPPSANIAAATFRRAMQDVVDAFSARIGDVSGDAFESGITRQTDEFVTSDAKEATENVALVEEIDSLEAQNMDLEEKLALLDEDRNELEKGLTELMKNVSMAKEFAATAKSGLFGAPKPQLQLGSFDDLDQDEDAFEDKHKSHPSHVDELATKTRPHANSPALAAAVLRSVEGNLNEPVPTSRHTTVVDAHVGLLAERVTLKKRRDELQRKLQVAQVAAEPLANKVLDATYNGVSLNMKVVGLSAPECDDDPNSPACRSRAWSR